MNRYFLLDLGNEKRHGYIIGGQLSESDTAYSSLLDVGFNRQDFIWHDERPHLHTTEFSRIKSRKLCHNTRYET